MSIQLWICSPNKDVLEVWCLGRFPSKASPLRFFFLSALNSAFVHTLQSGRSTVSCETYDQFLVGSRSVCEVAQLLGLYENFYTETGQPKFEGNVQYM